MTGSRLRSLREKGCPSMGLEAGAKKRGLVDIL